MTFRNSLGLAAILAGATACSQGHAQPADTRAPPTVSIVQVSPERVAVSSEWIATLDGLVNAQIRPQVSGYLIKAHYRDGRGVRGHRAPLRP